MTARLLLPGPGSITADCFACGPTDPPGGCPAYVPGGLAMTVPHDRPHMVRDSCGLPAADGRRVAGNGIATRGCGIAEETTASGGLPMLPAELPTGGFVPGDAGSNAP